ncbi:PIR protein CIR protein [Plasmodium vinckei brucechwatti]|uniref:PIR protein CIR protein n=1 Tax=Plasmodium vinckei brucechwatti TaxID=119398 RepID=A0A6V7RTY8_PLAVN|nr:PIR protein CIR protein [Plasmodium vinckei brucechwatti]
MGVTACEAFREVDELFINYEANEDEFNTDYGIYNKYCPVKNGSKRCETNYEKLIAISGHAYMELTNNNQIDIDGENDLSVDFLIMGLCHRLYKISKDHTLSLKDSFGKYLGNPIGGFNHWNILYNKKEFMGFNIGVMNGFYLLFKQICETISTSEKPNVQPYEYINGIVQCYIMYNELYNFVNQCDPYLRLLHHLKTIYDEFTKSVINYNNHDESIRNQIMGLSHIDTTKFRSEFNTTECKKLNKKLAKTTPKIIKLGIQMLKDDEKRKNGEGSQSTEDEDDEDFDLDEEEDDDNLDLDDDDDDDLGNNDNTTENPLNQIQNNPQGTPPVPAPGPQQQPSTQPISTTPSTDVQNGVVNNPNDSKGDINNQQTNQGDKQLSQNGDSANPDTSQGGSGGGSDNGGSSVPGSSEGGSGDESSGNESGGSEGPGGGKDSGGGDPGSGANDGSSGGSKAPGDQVPIHPSGEPNGYLPSNWISRFNPLNYLPSASEIYETQKSIITSASNKISDAYNSAVTTVKDTYDITMTAVKDTYDSAVIAVKDTYNSTLTNITNAYTTSTNYISGAVSSITNQLSSLGSFSQLGNDQPTLGGSGNSLPTENNSLKTLQTPNSDPNPLPLSQSQPPSVTLPPSQTLPSSPSQLQQVTPQNIQGTNLQPQSGSAQDSSQITNQNGGSNPVQSHDTKPLTGIFQTTDYSTDPSSTGSGITTGTVVKMNEKSSIWCIASNKKCNILGIGIISISIFAFLTIMYKYILFGSSKKSEKKNMKRVIKLVDGNKKTQIIIKSYDRNKHLKPIINSVGRKKDPLLNIYKLMQADPVPFINVFFLLIFFVYKRQLNYLEL